MRQEEESMLKYEVMAVNGARRLKEGIREAVCGFFTDESGDTNLISIVVVLVIVMALAVIFRKNIASLVNSMWQTIFTDANSATKSTGAAQTFS
jgi:hypothetical protein